MMVRSLSAALVCGLLLAPAAQARIATPDLLCGSMGELAVAVMQNRQYGVPQSDMEALAPADSEEGPVFLALIAEAYSVPVQETMAGRYEAIEGFRDAIEASCIATVRGMT